MVEERGEKRGRRRDRENPRERDNEASELVDKLVGINRVAKTVKGGKNFGFAALVVVGDQKGRAGFGKGKAREVPEAIRKGKEGAIRAMFRVPIVDGTIPHEVLGHYGAGQVLLKPASAGTGVIAELMLIEALRTLRIVQYAGWLARRWDDPAFPVNFPFFNTQRYWQDHVLALREQAAALDEPPLQWIG